MLSATGDQKSDKRFRRLQSAHHKPCSILLWWKNDRHHNHMSSEHKAKKSYSWSSNRSTNTPCTSTQNSRLDHCHVFRTLALVILQFHNSGCLINSAFEFSPPSSNIHQISTFPNGSISAPKSIVSKPRAIMTLKYDRHKVFSKTIPTRLGFVKATNG